MRKQIMFSSTFKWFPNKIIKTFKTNVPKKNLECYFVIDLMSNVYN